MASRTLIRSSRGRSNGSQWIPESLQESLRRFAQRVFGFSILSLAVVYFLVLLSYDASDPSWNTARLAQGEIHNLFGSFGSHFADLFWQFFGMASFIPVAVLVAWGWRIFTLGSLDVFGWRALAMLIAMLASSVTFGAIWPYVTEIGVWNSSGSLGRVAADGFRQILPNLWGRIVIAVVMGVLSLSTLYMACSLTIAEWSGLLKILRDGMRFLSQNLFEKSHSIFTFLRDKHASLSEDWDDEDEADDKSRRKPKATVSKDEDEEEEEDSSEDSDEHDEDSETEETDADEDEESESDEEESEEDAEEEEEEPPPPKSARGKKAKVAVVQRAPAVSKQARLAFSDESYPLPPLELLQWPDSARRGSLDVSKDALEKNAKQLESVLSDFGVFGQITKVSPGPVVTLYELEPSPGTRASRVISLADDIARNMSATSVRVAVVPGRNVIGIELPNKKREMVFLREVLSSDNYRDHPGSLPLVLGKDISGLPIIADLARMPHLLIAGTTGSGKSVAVNTMIMSLIYRLPPQKCRFIMIDPKMLELSVYEGIPHLLAPVVTEPKKAIMALKWTVREMEERYRAMSKLGVRNIEGYNIRLQQAAKNGENLTRKVQTGFDRETGKPIFEEQPLDLTPLPFIVVIVDEMADLMIVAGKEIEAAVQRLAQMARAAGIHIMMATQRPSVDVITGTIKANFPTRISFQVTSKIDSRTILGEQGAEQLLGQGDMLYMAGGGRVTRVHGPFVRDDEVEAIVKFLKAQGEPEYLDEVTEDSDEGGGVGGSSEGSSGESSGNDMYDKAVDIVLRERKASISFIQRHLQVGYNRAATIIERMEREGIVSAANHVGKREIFGRKPDDDDM